MTTTLLGSLLAAGLTAAFGGLIWMVAWSVRVSARKVRNIRALAYTCPRCYGRMARTVAASHEEGCARLGLQLADQIDERLAEWGLNPYLNPDPVDVASAAHLELSSVPASSSRRWWRQRRRP